MDASDMPDREKLKTAIQAEGNERIECPICSDKIPAFELASDHAHAKKLMELVLDTMSKEKTN